MHVLAAVFVGVTLAMVLITALVGVAKQESKKHDKRSGLEFKDSAWRKR